MEDDDVQTRPLWRRPVAWVVGILVTSCAAALTSYLTGLWGSWIEEAAEVGSPVSVDFVTTYRSPGTGGSVVFASESDFPEGDLAELNAFRSGGERSLSEQAEWLEQRGGVPLRSVQIQMALRSNRPNTVRITDIRTVKECSPPLRGVLMAAPAQGIDRSTRLFFDLDEPNPTATSIDVDGAFFPGQTISLVEGEQQVVLVEASSEDAFCSFHLQLTVLDENEYSVQEVWANDGGPFEVSGYAPDSDYGAIYIGTRCPDWVKPNPALQANDLNRGCQN